jgi:hypothetical protein
VKQSAADILAQFKVGRKFYVIQIAQIGHLNGMIASIAFYMVAVVLHLPKLV